MLTADISVNLQAILGFCVAILLCVGVLAFLFHRWTRRDHTQDSALWASIQALRQENKVREEELKEELAGINQRLDSLNGTLSTVAGNVTEIQGDLVEQKQLIEELERHELSPAVTELVEQIKSKVGDVGAKADAIKLATDEAAAVVPEPAAEE